MKHSLALRIGAVALFATVEIYLSYLIQTVSGRACNTVSYLSVALAAVFALGTLLFCRTLSDNLIRLGLGFTLIADYCLVLAEPTRELWGVVVFCFTQACYFLALLIEERERRTRIIHIAVRIALIAVVIPAAFAVLGNDTDALAVWSVFYYANLVCNMIFAFADFRRRGAFALGLLSFALCDVTLGLAFLGDAYLNSPPGSFLYEIGHTGLNLPWVFYVPSQTLIAAHLAFRRDRHRNAE